MTLTKTPICDFGKKAENFKLKSTDNKILSLDDIKGNKGTLIMFICNHCPYVKAVIEDIVSDCKELEKHGINSVAICSNDVKNYPEDSFDKMIEFSKIAFFSSSVTSLITLPGEPTTKELSGITLFSVIKALAPIIQFFPILALFKMTAPIPTKLLSPMVHP